MTSQRANMQHKFRSLQDSRVPGEPTILYRRWGAPVFCNIQQLIIIDNFSDDSDDWLLI